MSERDAKTRTDEREAPPGTSGVLLRVARETAGLSIDAVAQQLKLAPRQVKALEEGDYTHLPGRTFVRGFVRNYARLMHLDPERVLGALPAAAAAPALEAPTLQQNAPTMGELPTVDHSTSSSARWIIPLVLAAIVAAAAAYEWLRPAGEPRVAAGKDAAAPTAPADPAARSPGRTGGAGRALPNPFATNAPIAETAPAFALETRAVAAPPASTAVEVPVAGKDAAVAADEAAVVLAFRDYAWTEIRDRDGHVVVSQMNSGGTTRTVSGTPPLTLVIGNAADVTLQYNGVPVELAPHTRQNVARLTLP